MLVILKALLLLSATTLPCCTADILAASSLVVCDESDATTLACSSKFVIAMTVQNGQNATESIQTYKLSSAIDAGGFSYSFSETVRISLIKTPIKLQYPLSYERNFNSKPVERVLYADSSNTGFNWLTNPCIDSASANGACGWVLDAGGARVPYSNGFCCSCDLGNFFAPSNIHATRGNLDCDLFASSGSQAAHCLRMSPLWYAAFSIGPPEVVYVIYVVIERCRTAAGTNSSVPAAPTCTNDVISVSPSSPGACYMFEPWAGDAAVQRNASSSSGCDVLVALEGDFAAFTSPPDYSSSYLFVPSVCEVDTACGARMLEDWSHWMIVEKYLTTSGPGCNLIGVSYEAFTTQGSPCSAPVQSCLSNQLETFYQADLRAEAMGTVGNYFIKFVQRGNSISFDANVQSATAARMSFTTTRFQQSVITMQVSATSLRYTLLLSPGVIVSCQLPSFAALARGGGLLEVIVKNVGSVRSQYTIAIACTVGIAPVVAQQVTLAAGATSAVLFFALFTENMQGLSYPCDVSLQDANRRVVDVVRVVANTTATVLTKGGQEGTPPPLADGGVAPLDTNASSTSCASCGSWDLFCRFRHLCVGSISGWVAGAVAAIIGAVLLFKFPWLVGGPLKFLASLCCNRAPASASGAVLAAAVGGRGATASRSGQLATAPVRQQRKFKVHHLEEQQRKRGEERRRTAAESSDASDDDDVGDSANDSATSASFTTAPQRPDDPQGRMQRWQLEHLQRARRISSAAAGRRRNSAAFGPISVTRSASTREHAVGDPGGAAAASASRPAHLQRASLTDLGGVVKVNPLAVCSRASPIGEEDPSPLILSPSR